MVSGSDGLAVIPVGAKFSSISPAFGGDVERMLKLGAVLS
jgi:hypothetical protein